MNSQIKKDEIKRVLIIRFGAIGDFMLDTPLFREIRAFFPDAQISLLTEPQNRVIAERSPRFDYVNAIDRKSHKGNLKNVINQFKFYFDLRDEKYDLVIDLYNGGRSGLIAFLSGARYRLGWSNLFKSRIFTNINIYYQRTSEEHSIITKSRLLEEIGIKVSYYKREIFLFEDDSLNLPGWFSALELVVLLNPGTAHESKIWPMPYWADLYHELQKRGLSPVFITNKNQEYLLEEITANMSVKPRTLPLLELQVLGSAMSKSVAVVSGDTGPMHLSLGLDVPTVAIFGSSDHKNTGPLDECHIVIRNDVGCNPCFKNECPLIGGEYKKCLTSISVDSVMNAVIKLVNSPK
jgi:lipopolysaccharide heptosyltransferase II